MLLWFISSGWFIWHSMGAPFTTYELCIIVLILIATIFMSREEENDKLGAYLTVATLTSATIYCVANLANWTKFNTVMNRYVFANPVTHQLGEKDAATPTHLLLIAIAFVCALIPSGYFIARFMRLVLEMDWREMEDRDKDWGVKINEELAAKAEASIVAEKRATAVVDTNAVPVVDTTDADDDDTDIEPTLAEVSLRRAQQLIPKTRPGAQCNEEMTRFPVGATEYGEAAYIKRQHLLVAGASGSGKTGLIRALMYSMGDQVNIGRARIIGVDPKVVELSLMGNMFDELIEPDLGNDFHERTARMLEREERAMITRLIEMKVNRQDMHIPTPESPFTMLILDEFIDLIFLCSDQDIAKRIKTTLLSILSKGRAAGYMVVLATQSPKESILKEIREFCPQRTSLAVTEWRHVDMVHGNGARKSGIYSDKIPDTHQGTGFLYDNETRSTILVRYFYVTTDDTNVMNETYVYPNKKTGSTRYEPVDMSTQSNEPNMAAQALKVIPPFIAEASKDRFVQFQELSLWLGMDKDKMQEALKECGVRVFRTTRNPWRGDPYDTPVGGLGCMYSELVDKSNKPNTLT